MLYDCREAVFYDMSKVTMWPDKQLVWRVYWKSKCPLSTIYIGTAAISIRILGQLILQLFFSASTTSKSGRPVTCILNFAQIPYTLQCVSIGLDRDKSLYISNHSQQMLQ